MQKKNQQYREASSCCCFLNYHSRIPGKNVEHISLALLGIVKWYSFLTKLFGSPCRYTASLKESSILVASLLQGPQLLFIF